MMKRPDWLTRAAALGLLAAGLAASGCEDSNPVAPAESTITVSANPQTVVVPSGGGSGTTEIVARVRAKNGTPLPGQEVTFSSTGGTLSPPAETPLTTDNNGQSVSILTTTSAATVTARSGGITGMTQIQTAPGNLAQFILQVVPNELTGCNDDLTLTAMVATTTGDPVQGILVIFDEVSPGNLTGNFTPGSQILTDSAGMAVVMWTPSASVCAAGCQAATADPNDPTPGVCALFFNARDTTSAFESVDVEVDDNIP